jgi:glycosyltransferase involved in cell wall biosynthesis
MWRPQALGLLIKAMATLVAEEGADLHLVAIGDGPERVRWEQLAAALLPGGARFLGRVKRAEVPGYIAGADVCYAGHLNGRDGGIYHSPLKTYEYLAMARPVISSTSEDARAVLAEGTTGFLFQPGDLPGLTQALRAAYRMRERLPELGAEGRRRIVRDHDWTARAEVILRAAATLLRRP